MAPIKFEERIKEKLENRNLQPSPESWSALASRLDTDEKQSKTPVFWWLGIAASVVIMLAISIRFFSTKNPNTPTQQIVFEDNIKENNTSNTTENSNTNDTIIFNNNITKIKAETIITSAKESLKKPVKNNEQLVVNTSVKKSLNSTNNNANTTSKIKNVNTTIIKNETEVTHILDVVKKETDSNIDREVDSLLALAQNELFKDKLQREVKVTVDAKQLLDEVEEAMGQSFRSKVFEILTERYKTVKTAVVERNN